MFIDRFCNLRAFLQFGACKHSPFVLQSKRNGDVAQLVSALRSHRRGRGFESLHPHHEKSLFCLPRQERLFPAFRVKNRQNTALSGFGAVEGLLRSPIFCVQRQKQSQNAGILFAVLCRCKERLKGTKGTDLNQLFTENIHSSKDLITLNC